MSFAAQYDRFHELAAQASGLGDFSDFGPTDYVEPLKILLSDYDRYCRFNEMGAQITSGVIVGHLVGRLFAQQGFNTHAELLKTPIDRPIIITGMLRTGSTALLRLLSKDPELQSLTFWLASLPQPRPPRETWEANPMYQQIVQGVKQFYDAAPDLKSSHPVVPAEADECHVTTAQSFWSPALAMPTSCPTYKDWCHNADPHFCFERHRKVMTLIGGGDRRRWLLKDPCHLFGLDALLDVFPDACIVYTHREPTSSITSMASLLYQARHVREPDVPATQHGSEVLDFLGKAQCKAEAVRNRMDPAQFCDVHIKELHADPIGAVERIYRHFNIRLSDATRQSWQQHVNTDPKAGHGKHDYTMDDFGFSATQIYDSLGSYYDRYTSLYGGKSERT
jgi:Sulfotransferase family